MTLPVLTAVLAAIPGILAGLAALVHSFRVKASVAALQARLDDKLTK